MEVVAGSPMNDDELWEFCAEDRNRRIERHSNGEIVIKPLGGAELSHRNCHLNAQLGTWSEEDGRGAALINAGYLLPSGAVLGAYSSWVLWSRIEKLTKKQKQRFAPLCPDFVAELTSPADPLDAMKAKMLEWMENGASLGWLIDADNRTVYIYRPGQEPEALVDIDHVDGEGPVEGFRLDLADIWEGL